MNDEILIILPDKDYKVGLPKVDIDLTIASEVGHLNEKQVLETLLSIAERSNFCLLHMFTGEWIRRDDDGVLMDVSTDTKYGGAFSDDNIEATSIFDCQDDPWKMRCLLTFPHVLARSMGASKDEGSGERDHNSYLMPVANTDSIEIGPNNLVTY